MNDTTPELPTVQLCEKLKRKHFGNTATVQWVMQDLIYFTAANWNKLEPLWLAQVGYALNEGLHPRELWASKVRAQLKRKGKTK